MATQFDFPSSTPLVDDTQAVTLPWLQVFSRWHTVILSLQQSGTTANRPTSLLWVGRRYFDITLGKPVWIKSVGPTVWVDGSGAAV